MDEVTRTEIDAHGQLVRVTTPSTFAVAAGELEPGQILLGDWDYVRTNIASAYGDGLRILDVYLEEGDGEEAGDGTVLVKHEHGVNSYRADETVYIARSTARHVG